MKLSTKSRYGTRMLLDMAQHYNQGPVQLGGHRQTPEYLREVPGADHHPFEKGPLRGECAGAPKGGTP